jgi:hypothetical protein
VNEGMKARLVVLTDCIVELGTTPKPGGERGHDGYVEHSMTNDSATRVINAVRYLCKHV